MTLLSSLSLVALGASALLCQVASAKKDIPCLWTAPDKKHTYDLRPLIVPQNKESYVIIDGDVPCTPEIEPSYGYSWNFCSNVNPLPNACDNMGKSGVALQYIYIDEKHYDCYVIGKYNEKKDDLSFSLMNAVDPSEGVRMTYPYGETCAGTDLMRSATIDVQCADVDVQVVSAYATEMCSYHLLMKSWHGCPKSCAVTDNGLCNAHGHCSYDNQRKESYCYCDYGFGGDDCHRVSEEEAADNSGTSVQVGLMSTLLVVALIMITGLSYMTYRVMEFRKAQNVGVYNFLTSVELSQSTFGDDQTF